MGKLMDTIQVIARGQEVMAKMQEDMNRRAHAMNPPIPPVVETPFPHQVGPLIHIGAPGDVLPINLHPHVAEVDDEHDAFLSPRDASQYDAFDHVTNEVEKKVRAIGEKLKAMESTNVLGLDAAEMCLVNGVVIPAKFKVPDFEKNKGTSDPRTHIRAYCRKMTAYSNDSDF